MQSRSSAHPQCPAPHCESGTADAERKSSSIICTHLNKMTLITSWSLSSSDFLFDQQPAFQSWYKIKTVFIPPGGSSQVITHAHTGAVSVGPSWTSYTHRTEAFITNYFWAATHIHTTQVNTHLWTLILQRSQQHLSEGDC